MGYTVTPKRDTHLAVARALAAGHQYVGDIAKHAGIGDTTAYTSLRALVSKGFVDRERVNPNTKRAKFWLVGSIEAVTKALAPAEKSLDSGPFSARELEQAWQHQVAVPTGNGRVTLRVGR